MEADIILEGFDPLHVVDWHENGALAGSNCESFKLPRGIRDGIEHRQDLLCSILLRRASQPADGPPERKRKAFLGYRREEIVDRCDFERPDRQRIPACGKNNDADTMARILSDDFVLTLGTGQTYTKADLLNKGRTKEVVYEENEDTDKTVRMWGGNAIVTSKLWLKGVEGKTFRVARLVQRYLCTDSVRMAIRERFRVAPCWTAFPQRLP